MTRDFTAVVPLTTRGGGAGRSCALRLFWDGIVRRRGDGSLHICQGTRTSTDTAHSTGDTAAGMSLSVHGGFVFETGFHIKQSDNTNKRGIGRGQEEKHSKE